MADNGEVNAGGIAAMVDYVQEARGNARTSAATLKGSATLHPGSIQHQNLQGSFPRQIGYVSSEDLTTPPV